MTETWQEDVSYEPVPYPERFDYPDAEMIARARAFYAHMQKRHTVRDFSDQPVPREVIETCLLW